MASFSPPAGSPLTSFDSAVSPQGRQSLEESDEDGSDDIEYVIISRRSRQRAGLRYQRRGIDEDANVANFVETEVIMKITVSLSWWPQKTACLTFPYPQRNERLNVFSYVQLRGSSELVSSSPSQLSSNLPLLVPIFWSQPGYSLKPVPKLDRTPSESAHALKRHFEKTVSIYGPQVRGLLFLIVIGVG